MPRTTVASLAADVAALTEVVSKLVATVEANTEAPKASRRRKPKAAKTFPAVDSTFTYTSKAGNSVDHTIEAIRGRGKRRRAFTESGNKFPVSLLSNERLQAEGVVSNIQL